MGRVGEGVDGGEQMAREDVRIAETASTNRQFSTVPRLAASAGAPHYRGPMATFRIDVVPATPAPDLHLAHEARLLGLERIQEVRRSRYYLIQGDLDERGATRLAKTLLSDPVIEQVSLVPNSANGRRVIEVQRKT